MAILHTYCKPTAFPPAYLVGTGKVPTGKTLRAGMVVDASKLDATEGSGNISTYAAIAPTEVKTQKLAIVLSGGLETLLDGRRPEGQPDYTQYEFVEGDIVNLVFLEDGLKFQISKDCLTTGAVPVVGSFLNAVNATTQLVVGAEKASTDCLVIEAITSFNIGGNGGLGKTPLITAKVSSGNTIA